MTQSATTAAFVPFNAFIKATENARYQNYAQDRVRNTQAFDQMRSYILATYRGAAVSHSFVYGGSYFDCVPVRSQPTVRDLGIRKIAAAPPAAPVKGRQTGHAVPSPLTMGLKDAYGNPVSCPSATIPMSRITLGLTTTFPTMAAFLAKSPAGQAKTRIPPGGPHRYAIGYQYVTNYGGNSWLNVWNPSGEFSLSQQWYVNGSGAGTQTVEGGWVHYPALFGARSVLFIFSTPNDYASGCYNLMCPGFVQISPYVALGAGFTNYSTYGGTQWGFGLQWKYYNGNWWMFYSGVAIGYYPGSVFRGGPMSRNAAITEYGGETYTSGTYWPQMGSGKFAYAGFAQAAFQNTIFYIPQNVNGGYGVWSSLTPLATNPNCYTINLVNYPFGGSWGTYFYFGGPGGYC